MPYTSFSLPIVSLATVHHRKYLGEVEISRLIRKPSQGGYFLLRLFKGSKGKEHHGIKEGNIRQTKAFPSFLKLQVMNGNISK